MSTSGVELLIREEGQSKAILYFYLMVFQCARKSVKESEFSMNGIYTNTKYIYECMHKVCSSSGPYINFMDLRYSISDLAFEGIPFSSQEIFFNLRINIELLSTGDI